jgi:hypothetical protein
MGFEGFATAVRALTKARTLGALRAWAASSAGLVPCAEAPRVSAQPKVASQTLERLVFASHGRAINGEREEGMVKA